MKKAFPKIVYDKESKVLSFEMASVKSADSDIYDNVVIDYDKNGRPVRFNFYDFSFDAFRENREALREFAKARDITLAIAR